jgi:aryl-alcohol dehydrogenase-like predicted oxidoreductase
MKLALGTVQFGMKYGINNISNIPKDDELNNIFEEANKSEIKFIDTSFVYGNSEERIGKLYNKKFNIISKFPYSKNESELLFYFNSSLKRLNVKKLYGYLAHDPLNLIEQPHLWDTLLKLKQDGLISKIGYSLYYPEELDKLLDLKLEPDLIQIPYNIIDRKFNKHIKYLKIKKVEIHARSIFMQGIFFKNYSDFPAKAASIIPIIDTIKTIAINNNLTIDSLCLNYINSNENIDKIVIGIDNLAQLKTNINIVNNEILSKEIIKKIDTISITDDKFFNPSNW